MPVAKEKKESGSHTQRVSHAAFWGYSGHLAGMLLQIGGTIILARLLTPGEYGVIAVVTVFFGIGSLISNCGLGGALLRQKEISPNDWTTVYYYNLGASVICMALLMLAAPWIADFYQKEILRSVLLVLPLTLPLNALGTTRNLYLTRNLRQMALTGIGLASTAAGFVAAFFAALYGLGVWALVLQQIAAALMKNATLYVLVPRVSSGCFCRKSFIRLFDFGGKMFSAGIINVVFDNLYGVIIGKCYSLREVGLFDKALKIGSVPSAGINGTLSAILLPTLGRIQDDPNALRSVCRKMLLVSSSFVVLFSIIAYTGGESIILLVLGQQWLEVLPLYKLIVISSLLMPLHIVNVQLLLAMNKPHWFLYSDILKKLLYVIFILLTFRHGVYAMLLGQVGISIFAGMINGFFGHLLIGYGFWRQMRDLLPVFGFGIPAALAAYGMCLPVSDAYAWAKIFPALAGSAMVYIPLICIFYKINPWIFLKQQMPVIFRRSTMEETI